jgi:hypothetical protein
MCHVRSTAKARAVDHVHQLIAGDNEIVVELRTVSQLCGRGLLSQDATRHLDLQSEMMRDGAPLPLAT